MYYTLTYIIYIYTYVYYIPTHILYIYIYTHIAKLHTEFMPRAFVPTRGHTYFLKLWLLPFTTTACELPEGFLCPQLSPGKINLSSS